MSKRVALLLLVILLSLILMMGENVFAQSVPNLYSPAQSMPRPSVPKFTVEYIDNSYDVPSTTTSTTNPYNNKTTTTTSPGYHVKNFTIEVTITNQLFPSSINGNATNLYYDVRVKGNFGEDWNYLYSSPLNSASYSGVLYGYNADSLPAQSSSDYTVLSFPANSYPSDGVVDFQVKAILGYQYLDNEYYPPHMIPMGMRIFVYESSSWSKTQTLDIGASQTPTPSPETTPSTTPNEELHTNELTLIIGATIVAIVIGVGLLIYLIKRK